MKPDVNEHSKKGEWALSFDGRIISVALLFILAVTVVLAEFFIEPKGYFSIVKTFGFYLWFGLLACLVTWVLGAVIGSVLQRGEDVYDD